MFVSWTRANALPASLLLLLSCGPAWAQGDEDGGAATEEPVKATIRLMGDAADNLPGAVTKEIRLPENLPAESAAASNDQRGRDTANSNRLEGNQGIDQAEAAHDRGAAMAEAAQDNRETRGRSGDRPDPPGPPETPGPRRP